jgi:hypothetical protein
MIQGSRGEATGASPQTTMAEMIYGMINTQMLYAVVQLGIADLLRDGPRSVDQLAAATGADASSLHRVLRLLASNGVFMQTEHGSFALNPSAELLRSDVPGSLAAMATYYGSPWHWAAWGNTLEAVRTGRSAFESVHGVPLFEYLEQHRDAAAVFNRHMASMPFRRQDTAVAAYDFSSKKLVVDVGGGHGAFLISILGANPGLQGLLVDQPSVVAGAKDALAAADVAERCGYVASNIFQSVPTGGDVYILSNILHDWDDKQSVQILQSCRRAMANDSVLLIRESIVPEGNESSPAKRVDVMMLVLTGGLQRTESEFEALLEKADFRLARVISLGRGGDLLEAAPV